MLQINGWFLVELIVLGLIVYACFDGPKRLVRSFSQRIEVWIFAVLFILVAVIAISQNLAK